MRRSPLLAVFLAVACTDPAASGADGGSRDGAADDALTSTDADAGATSACGTSAALPGWVEVSAAHRFAATGTTRRVEITALDDGVCDYVAPIFAADFAPRPETMRWIWARILDQLPNADLVFLEKISERVGDRRNPLLDLAQPAPSRFRRHPLALGDGLDAVRARYRAGRSLARKHRKLARKGRLDFAVLTGSEAAGEIDGLMAWRDRRHDARPITTAFYRRLLADTDLARVGLLRLDGRAISGCFAIVCDGALRLLVVAFDERWKNWSPGLLAIDEMIGWAAGEGLAEFDFTIGSEAYKFDFGVETEPLWEIREPLGLRGSVMLRLLGARRAAADLVRRTLPSLAAVHARRHGEHPTPPLPPAP